MKNLRLFLIPLLGLFLTTVTLTVFLSSCEQHQDISSDLTTGVSIQEKTNHEDYVISLLNKHRKAGRKGIYVKDGVIYSNPTDSLIKRLFSGAESRANSYVTGEMWFTQSVPAAYLSISNESPAGGASFLTVPSGDTYGVVTITPSTIYPVVKFSYGIQGVPAPVEVNHTVFLTGVPYPGPHYCGPAHYGAFYHIGSSMVQNQTKTIMSAWTPPYLGAYANACFY